MKRTLILMRHAKSSWDSMTLEDHERPLNERGISAAASLGIWFSRQKLSPSEALVSTSKRTQETFTGLKLDLAPTLLDSLYHASSDTLLEAIHSASPSTETLLVVAHNPGIGELAFRLARMMRTIPDHTRFEDFPTGATLIVEWETDTWTNLDYSQGKIIQFITPADIS